MFFQLETDAKKVDSLKISPLVKDPQFLSNQADIQAFLTTHELVISSFISFGKKLWIF